MNAHDDNSKGFYIPYHYAKRHQVLCTITNAGQTQLCYTDATPPIVLSEVQRHLESGYCLTKLTTSEFQNTLTTTFESTQQETQALAADIGDTLDLDELVHSMPKAEDLLERQDDAPVIRLLNALFTQAIKQKASDIHFETFEDHLSVRLRVDGLLHETLRLQRVLSPMVISRLKVMSKLDIAEKRIPQDGRMTLKIAGHTVDVRISTIPASHAERVVLRILDQQTARLSLDALGMQEKPHRIVKKLIQEPHGIILITGPTGSGKTTSLYAMLTSLNDPSRNILTVEDPIEYDLPGIGQSQVNPKVNMTFAKGLRAILRQDPDVVMVGEIRDLETAEITVQASLTGHLVLSTLHTNSALGAIARLRDMGVETYLLSSSLIGLIAQRLVRTLCEMCKTSLSPDERIRKQLTLQPEQVIFTAKGCDACNQTGYRGRTGIYEVIPVVKTLRQLIHDDASEAEMEKQVRQTIPSLLVDGYALVSAGKTSLDEVVRVTSEL